MKFVMALEAKLDEDRDEVEKKEKEENWGVWSRS